ncbi:20696_t:CDS:2 [Funneliformis geosporum]|uniref:19606_t:CDS:1 n=1 Tax=Funneliformis geosporum TaxID=1117311 RepID=A0A9W4SAV0_9GLOM|nr:20696_t:CDS:2 [Funneliformis geosporum]CAI2162125.1 19606_t:CDS:2 [Funneliformis geosporum]
MTSIANLPTELLEQMISYLDYPSLLNCLYQNHKFFSLTIPLVWKNLGESYWGSTAKTPLRWHLISNTLSSSEYNFINYANFVQKIDLSCTFSPAFRIPKQTLFHLLIHGIKLREVYFEYHKESSNVEPFECLNEILSPSFIDHHDNSVSPTLIISLFSKYINTLEELTLKIMYELNPLPMDDLRYLVINNINLKHMDLFTLQGARVLDEENLNTFRSNGELPNADYWWTDGII